MTSHPVALTIAGSDCSGGAGIQADLKTFHQHGVYGCSVLTLITAQNSLGVHRSEPLDASLIGAQLRAVLEDLPVAAIKIGALGSGAIVSVVAEILGQYPHIPVVLDTVLASKRGVALLDPNALETFKDSLCKRATVLTPNRVEAELLTASGSMDASPAERLRLAKRVLLLGAKSVLLKGGHFDGPTSSDLLLWPDESFEEFASPRQSTVHTHGTGCTLSSAIAANLAKKSSVRESVSRAHHYVQRAIKAAPGALHLAENGVGALDHFVATD